MAQSQNTVREIFVADALASETTLKTFESGASDGELGVFMIDGSDGDTTGEFLIAIKLAGKTIVSDKYKSEEIRRAIGKPYQAPVLRKISITPTNTTVGTEYIINLRIQEFGSLSVNDFYFKHGQYEVATGDAATDIVDGLITSLNLNFSQEPQATPTSNSYFTFVNNSGVLEITEKEQEVILGKKEGRPIAFDVTVDKVGGASIATVAVTDGGFPGVGTGRQVALMEYFYRGNRGDAFRDQHFPYNFSKVTKSQASLTSLYGLIELQAVRKQDEEFNVVTSRKEATIAVPVTAGVGGVTAFNAIIDKIELVTGKTIAAVSEF